MKYPKLQRSPHWFRSSFFFYGVLLCGVLVIAALTYLYYDVTRSSFIEKMERELAVVTDMKRNEMANWRRSLFDAPEDVRRSLYVQRAVVSYLQHPTPEQSADLENYLTGLGNTPENYSTVLCDAAGVVVLPAIDSGYKVHPLVQAAIRRAFRTGRTSISDLISGEERDRDIVYSAIPFFRMDGQIRELAGTIIMKADMRPAAASLFRQWPEILGMTPSLTVINSVGEVLRTFNYTDDSFKMRIYTENEIDAAFSQYFFLKSPPEHIEIVKGRDHLHTPVIAALAPLGGNDLWWITVQLPESAVQERLGRLGQRVLFSALILIFAWLAGLYILRIRHQRKYAGLALEERDIYLAHCLRYEQLIQHSRDVFFLLDPKHRIVETNDRVAEFFGQPRAAVYGRRFEHLFAPEEAPRLFTYINELLNGNTRLIELRGRHPEGYHFPVELNGSILRLQEQLYVEIVARDISERVQYEKLQENVDDNLKSTLAAIPDAVITVNRSGAVTMMNPGAERLTGWMFKDAAGRPVETVAPLASAADGSVIAHPLVRCMAKDGLTSNDRDLLLQTHYGAMVHVAVSANPIVTGGVLFGAVMLVRDISGDKRQEDRLRHGQKMEAVGLLAGGIAHDFNNMLTGILGACDIMISKEYCQPAAQQYLTIIRDSAVRAESLTKKLLAFSSRNTSVSAVVNAGELVETAASLIQQGLDPRITLNVRHFPRELMISGDYSALQNALLNIGTNAKEAMPDGGTLTLTVGICSFNHETASALHSELEPGNYAEIAIENSGRSIPPENLPRIFEPFFTTKPAGTGAGLGLCASHNIIREHRGAISVSSNDAHTVFKVFLPLLNEVDTAFAKERDLVVPGTGGVLIVDDELVVRSVAKELLGIAGYRVLTAADGFVGVDMCLEHGGEIDIVLLDMVMPGRDGRETYRLIREFAPDLPVILMSGFDHASAVDELLKDGASAFIAKPYTITELSALIADTLQKFRENRYRP